MTTQLTVKYLDARDEAAALAALESSAKYYFITLLLDDCMCRVSEAVSLKVRDFNFQKPSVLINTLKKRKKSIREVPMTRRVLDAAAVYWTSLKVKPKHDDFMFPAGNGKVDDHLSRKTVWATLKEKTGFKPHAYRHTGATKLVENGASLLVVRDILGHDRTTTTEIYTHTSEARRTAAIATLETKANRFAAWRERLFPTRKVHVLPLSIGNNKFHIGREVEIRKIHELAEKKVNTLVLGAQGTGKSHLLDNLKFEKMMRIDDTRDFKKVLANMVLHLCQGEKKDLSEMMNLDSRPECITKLSVKSSMLLLTQLTEPQEYTLIIDDATNVTKATIPTLEALRSHFHIIVAAREIPIAFTSWLTNFEKIRLEPLKRAEALELIKRQSEDFKNQIEDLTAFQTAVYSATNGNPLAISEMVQRWRVEGYVRADAIDAITHSSARSERSIMPFVLIGLACVVVVKFIAKEGDESNKEMYGILGSIALVSLMLFTRLGNQIKTRFVR